MEFIKNQMQNIYLKILARNIIKYPFPNNLKNLQYRIFEDDIESNSDIFFHITNIKNACSIIKIGFRPNPLHGATFFAQTSDKTWVFSVNTEKPHCVLVVQYDGCNRKNICNPGNAGFRDGILNPQPKIIGLCYIPDCYKHT